MRRASLEEIPAIASDPLVERARAELARTSRWRPIRRARARARRDRAIARARVSYEHADQTESGR